MLLSLQISTSNASAIETVYVINNAPLWWSFDVSNKTLGDVSISKNSQYVVAGGYPGGVYFFNRSRNFPLWSVLTNDYIGSVVISSDGKYVAAATVAPCILYLFDIHGNIIWAYNTSFNHGYIDMSADGRYIVITGKDSNSPMWAVHLFTKDSNMPLWSYVYEGGYPTSVSMSENGDYFVVGKAPGAGPPYLQSVLLFNKNNSTPLWTAYLGSTDPDYWGRGDGIAWAKISKDGNYISVIVHRLLERGVGTEIYYFHRSSNISLWSYNFGSGVAYRHAISSNGSYIFLGFSTDLSSENAGKVYLLNNSGEILWSYLTIGDVRDISISEDGDYMVASSHKDGAGGEIYYFQRNNNITLWRYQTADVLGLSGGVRVSISGDGKYVVAGGEDGSVYYLGSEGIIIDKCYVDKSHCDINSVRVISFHATWVNGSVASDGYIYINGIQCLTNSSGWATLNYCSPKVCRLTWVVTSVNFHGITAFCQLIPDPSIIWDRVNITLTVVDDRINVGESAIINWSGFYEYDGTPFSGSVFYNDTLIKSVVGCYCYTAASIYDPTYNLTAFTSNSVSVIFDKVQIELFVIKNRINVGEKMNLKWRGVYEYDNTLFTGSITLNDTQLSYHTVGRRGYRVKYITDDVYGITVFSSNKVFCIWDKVNITLSVLDYRIDVGSPMLWDFTAIYAYDDKDAKHYLSIDLNDTVIKYTVGKWVFKVKTINDSKYDLRVFDTNTIECIWDRVSITLEIVNHRIAVGSYVNITWRGFYEYDKHGFLGSISFNDTLSKNVIGHYGYTVESINDSLYNLTVFTSNTVYCIFDWIQAKYEIETLTPGRILLIIKLSFVYDNTPVEDAIVTINAVEAENTGKGIYKASFNSWMPYLSMNIRIKRDGFDTIMIETEVYALGNIVTETILVILIMVIIFMIFKKKGEKILSYV